VELKVKQADCPPRKTGLFRACPAEIMVPEAGLEPARPFRIKGF